MTETQIKKRDSLLAVVGLGSLLSTLLIYSAAVLPFLRHDGFSSIVGDFVIACLGATVIVALVAIVFALGRKLVPFSILIALGGAAYLSSAAILSFFSFSGGNDFAFILPTAIIAALGDVALCLVWGRIFARFNMRQALLHVSVASIISAAICEVTILLSPEYAIVLFFICATLAVVLPVVIKESTSHNEKSALPDARKLIETLSSFLGVITGPIIGLLFFAFIMGVMRASFAESYHSYLISLLIVSAILLGYAFQRKKKLVMRGLHQTFIPLSAIILLTIISITASLGQGSDLTMFFIYLVYTFAAIITLATLCAIAHAAEFSSDLVFAAAVLLFALLSVAGQLTSELLATFGTNVVISVITTLYAFVMVLSGYLKRHRVHNDEDEVTAPTAENLSQRCERLSETHHLTTREREILVYLAQGHTGAYISEVLFISPNTARTHIHNIYRKLDITSREDILRLTSADSENQT